LSDQQVIPAVSLQSFKTQARVIVALTIRGMQEDAGASALGYFSTFVAPLITVAVFLTTHLLLKSLSPPGLPAVMFIILGVIPYYMFLATMRRVQNSARVARSVLPLPGVTMLDVIISQCLTEYCAYAILFVGLAGLTIVFERDPLPANPLAVATAFTSAWLLGWGFGLVLLALEKVVPGADNFGKIISRAGMLTSGLFFIVGQLPQATWPYLDWNPVLSVNEFMRSYWFPVYQSPIATWTYITECIVGLFVVGLIFERAIRRVVE
jgi:capsular polysaccharide transport system permease protein